MIALILCIIFGIIIVGIVFTVAYIVINLLVEGYMEDKDEARNTNN